MAIDNQIFIRVTQSIKDAQSVFSTLSNELPKRMKGPILVTTEIFGVKSTREIKLKDPSYNLLDPDENYL